MSSSRWRKSPSHGKCSRKYCGLSQNCDRSHHQRRREAFDGYAFKSDRWEECVPMPGKIARSPPRPPFGLAEVPVTVGTSRLSCGNAGKARILTPVWESSGESRFKAVLIIELPCESAIVAEVGVQFINIQRGRGM